MVTCGRLTRPLSVPRFLSFFDIHQSMSVIIRLEAGEKKWQTMTTCISLSLSVSLSFSLTHDSCPPPSFLYTSIMLVTLPPSLHDIFMLIIVNTIITPVSPWLPRFFKIKSRWKLYLRFVMFFPHCFTLYRPRNTWVWKGDQFQYHLFKHHKINKVAIWWHSVWWGHL